MDYGTNEFYSPDDYESIQENQETENYRLDEVTDSNEHHSIHKSYNPALVAYGAYRISEIPSVKETINDCKETISEKIADVKEILGDFCEKLGDNIRDYTVGLYESVKDFFVESKEADDKAFSIYSKEFTETREFGIDHCVEAAREFFNEDAINAWAFLSDSQRIDICNAYASEVAKAFELDNYEGVIYEQLEPGVNGYNSGDGYAHISTDLLNPLQSPMQLIDTITHELRHQYQSECVNGLHDVSDEVRNEWGMATAIYNDGPAWCYDPWGYSYNPLEIDSRFAAESVVRELTSKMFNDAINALA